MKNRKDNNLRSTTRVVAGRARIDNLHPDNFYHTLNMEKWLRRASYGTLVVDFEAGWVTDNIAQVKINDQLRVILERMGFTESFYRFEGKAMPARFKFEKTAVLDPQKITSAFVMTPLVHHTYKCDQRIFLRQPSGEIATASDHYLQLLKEEITGQLFLGKSEPDMLYAMYKDELVFTVATTKFNLGFHIEKK